MRSLDFPTNLAHSVAFGLDKDGNLARIVFSASGVPFGNEQLESSECVFTNS